MHFNVWLKTNSRQWILAGDIDAMVKRVIRDGAERKRINLLECEAVVDHMRLLIGAPDAGEISRIKHLLTGASARLTLRAASDIQFNAGVSHFWQKRQAAEPVAAEALLGVRRFMNPEKGTEGEA